jgi:hypothetical protein
LGIVTEYPVGFIFFCLLIGAIYAFALYFRTKKDDISKWLVYLMTSFRFLTVSLIAFLLLSPLIKKQTEIIQKPLIILAQDNSRSILLSKDSGFYRKNYPEDIRNFSNDLHKKFDVAELSFGDRISNGLQTGFTEQETDISSLFDEVNIRYANRNIGALIIASDGIYNKGSDPFYASEKIRFPVFTIALGDTNLPRDLIIKKIICNKTVFLGDKFPVEIQIEADKCRNEKTELNVMQGDEVLFTRTLQFSGDKDFQKIELNLEAKSKGLQRYKVHLKPVDHENSVLNNIQEFFVDVNETRQKVAILFQIPHPDIFAIKQALEGSTRFEVETFKLDAFDQKPSKYDLIVLDQVPSNLGYFNLSTITGSKVSLLYILGTETNVDAFNSLKSGLVITSSKLNFTETFPAINGDFSLFTLDKELQDVLKDVPPLISPMGTYQFSPVSDVLFNQNIGNVHTRIPLVFFFQAMDHKVGIIAGENIWKWRLSDYLQKGDHKVFDDLINKMVQYLSVKGDKSFFKVKVNNRFMENENVEFDAEVYNETYELINKDDVNLIIKDEKNNSYPFVFGKTEKAYYLNTGTFPVGSYSYTATAKIGKNTFTTKGEFIVSPLNLEFLNSVADHNLLYRISKAHDGEMFSPRDLHELEKKIMEREDIRQVSYSQKRFIDLSSNAWLFLLILALLSAEWFIRKRSGIY